jgi:hypothetical protein
MANAFSIIRRRWVSSRHRPTPVPVMDALKQPQDAELAQAAAAARSSRCTVLKARRPWRASGAIEALTSRELA